MPFPQNEVTSILEIITHILPLDLEIFENRIGG